MNDLFAVFYDFVKLGIFSSSLTQACAVAMTEILFSVVENIIDRKLRIIPQRIQDNVTQSVL